MIRAKKNSQLNQLLLPTRVEFEDVLGTEDAWNTIYHMKVTTKYLY